MEQEPDRKRGHYESSSSTHQKRARPDEFIPRSHSHSSGSNTPEAYSRLYLNQVSIAKVIGKGGAMIRNIRQQNGSAIKTVDANEDDRMLVISGTFVQVIDTFDAVSDLLFSSHLHSPSSGSDPFTVVVMIDNARAGLIIGSKGSTMQSLKATSHVSQLHLSKEPVDVAGHQYRLLTIAGTLPAVRRAHYLVVDLFHDFTSLLNRVGVHGLGPIRGTTLREMLMVGDSFGPSPTFNEPRGFPPSSNQLSNVIPLPLLNSRAGLHMDVVNQLGEMQAYIGQFGLEMQILDKRSTPKPQTPHYYPRSHSMSSSHMPVSRADGSHSLTHAQAQHVAGGASGYSTMKTLDFLIQKDQAGALIGKGGQGLRDIRQETGCRVSVSRDEINGMRVVTLHNESTDILEKTRDILLAKISSDSSDNNDPY